MSKDSSEYDLHIQLIQALESKNTNQVYKLYEAGAKLEGFTVIGISNIRGEWSSNVAKSTQAFIDQNPGVYYLPINEIEQVQDDSFIKHFSGLINPGAGDSFPSGISFQLSDLDKEKMLKNEHLYQAVIDQSSKFHIPYLGICSGSQHLVLNNKGFLKREPGYIGGNHKANFIYGTIPYFMTLNSQEQEKALTECAFPEISFSIYTAHNYAAKKDKLGGVKLAAISEEGVVEAHSKGTTQIGVQFHPENYYFDTSYPINRQKQFLDNFFMLCKRHNEILNFAIENNLSEQQIHDRMNAYDIAILSQLQSCANKGVSPAPLQIPLLADYDVSLNPTSLAKESYDQIIKGQIDHYLGKMDFSDQRIKHTVLQAIEDKHTLQQFLQLDNQPQEIQNLFLELEEDLQSPDKDNSFITQKFLKLFDTKGDLGQYAFARVIKSQRFELASEIIFKTPHIMSSISFEQTSKTTRLKIADSLAEKGHTEQALEIIKTIATPELAIFEAIKENQKEIFKMLLPKVTDQGVLEKSFWDVLNNDRQEMFNQLLPKVTDQAALGKALYYAANNDRQEMFNQLLPKVTDQDALDKAFGYAIYYDRQEMLNQILPKVTDQAALGKALYYAVEANQQEMFNQLFPKITVQGALGDAFWIAVYYDRYKMFNQLFPKITVQETLGKALYCAVNANLQEMFYQLLPKVTDQAELGKALPRAAEANRQEMFNQLLPKVTEQRALGEALKYAISLNNQEMFNQLLPKITDQEVLGEALRSAISSNRQEMFKQLLPKITAQGELGEALKFIIRNDNLETFEKTLARINDKSTLNNLVKEFRDKARLSDSQKTMIDLIEKKVYPLNYPWLHSATVALGKINKQIKHYDPFKLLGGAEVSSAPTSIVQPPLVIPTINGTIFGNSSGALPSGTDQSTPAQAGGNSFQNIGAQVALAAVAGTLLYGAGKAAYNLYHRNTGPDAKAEDIERATILLKEVAKLDPKDLSKLSQTFKTKHDQITDRLNELYDVRKSNSDEYTNLREQLDKVTLEQNAISTIQNSMKSMKSEAKHFVEPKYALKQGYVVGIIKECSNIKDIYEKLEVSSSKSPKTHAQKVMEERHGKSPSKTIV